MINEELIKSVKPVPASPSLRAEFDLLAAKAFLAIPDAVYLFNNGRFLIQSNPPGSRLQGCESDELIARNCCEMFWHVEGADGCVVDRALQIGERVEVEIQAGADGNKAISIIVEPLSAGDDVNQPRSLLPETSPNFGVQRLRPLHTNHFLPALQIEPPMRSMRWMPRVELPG